jgi:hypothetical protein
MIAAPRCGAQQKIEGGDDGSARRGRISFKRGSPRHQTELGLDGAANQGEVRAADGVRGGFGRWLDSSTRLVVCGNGGS